MCRARLSPEEISPASAQWSGAVTCVQFLSAGDGMGVWGVASRLLGLPLSSLSRMRIHACTGASLARTWAAGGILCGSRRRSTVCVVLTLSHIGGGGRNTSTSGQLPKGFCQKQRMGQRLQQHALCVSVVGRGGAQPFRCATATSPSSGLKNTRPRPLARSRPAPPARRHTCVITVLSH